MADVYPAGESPIAGVDKDALVRGLSASGYRNVHALKNPNKLARLINSLATVGDMVVCLGAGTITQWANELPAQMTSLAIEVNLNGSS